MNMVLTQLMVLGSALALQLALIPLNASKGWLTPGELRFWTIAMFVLVELAYLAIA